MILQPEIALPNKLEIGFSQEILDWITENILDLKFIVISKYIQRDKYEQVMRIDIQENSKESPLIIYETIYKVLEYFTNIENNSYKYKLSIYRKINTNSDNVKTKYIIVEQDIK